jgi:hypothetical protein
MARLLLERAMDAAHFDDLFERMAVTQYTRTALFSDIIALLMTVTTRMHRSVGSAYHEHKGRLGVSFVALFGKLKRTDLTLMSALVRENSQRLGEVISELKAERAPLVPGYRTRIVDGNALGATEHRLDVLRDTRSGPLPGKGLVVYDYERDLTTDLLPCDPKRYPKARKYPRKRSMKSQRGKPDDPPHVSTYRLLRAKQALNNPGKVAV